MSGMTLSWLPLMWNHHLTVQERKGNVVWKEEFRWQWHWFLRWGSAVISAAFTFLELLRFSWGKKWKKKCVLERSKERSSFIWQRNKEWEGRTLRDSDVFAKKETDGGRVSGKFWWSWKDWIKEVPFRVGSVVFNITTSLAPSQIK